MPDSEPLADWPKEERDELIGLAGLTSLATWVEPGLLRRLRLDLLPASDAGLEARLWFSPLVKAQNATGFALHPEVRCWLRDRLAADRERLLVVWKHTSMAHAGAPPTVRLEEEVTFLGLSGADSGLIEPKLREALVALVDQGRTGLASWAARALPLFPPNVRNTETAWLLAAAASKELGGPAVLQEDAAGRVDPATMRRVLGSAGHVFIGVRLLENGVEFGPPELPGAKLIQVPRASPVVLDVELLMPPHALGRRQSVTFNLGERKSVDWGQGTPPPVCILHSDLDRALPAELRRALATAGVNLALKFGGGSSQLERLEQSLAAGNPIPANEIPTVLDKISPETLVIVISSPGLLKAGSAFSALMKFVSRGGGPNVMVVEDRGGKADSLKSPFSGSPVRMLDGDVRQPETIRQILDWVRPVLPPPSEVRIETLLQERHILRPVTSAVELSPAAAALRDRLSRPGPKRILSLEGGGVRTASSFGFLRRMESLLQRRAGREGFRLADYFDLIGGSSAGSVIAACLALRMSVEEAEAVWIRFVSEVFGRRSSLFRRLQQRFDDAALNRSLAAVFGNRTLTDDALVTGLSLIVKRMDTGDTVSLTNHPTSRYHAQRRTMMLRDALRAALAAPTMFAPVQLALGTESPGVYMDAGATVAVDPAWHLFRLATSRRHPFGWTAGAEELLVVSVGAGTWRETRSAKEIAGAGWIQWTGGLPNLLLRSARRQTEERLESLGRLLTPPRTPLAGMFGDGARLSLARYNIELDADRLAEMGLGELAREVEALRGVDDPEKAAALQQIGRSAAERDVREGHFPSEFDPLPAGNESTGTRSKDRPFVYLSFAEEDRAVARLVANQLMNADVQVLLSGEHPMSTGQDSDSAMETNIQQCTLFIPLISQNTEKMREGWVFREWNKAAERALRFAPGQKLIFPLLVGEVEPSLANVPQIFRTLQMIPLEDGQLPSGLLDLIKTSVRTEPAA